MASGAGNLYFKAQISQVRPDSGPKLPCSPVHALRRSAHSRSALNVCFLKAVLVDHGPFSPRVSYVRAVLVLAARKILSPMSKR